MSPARPTETAERYLETIFYMEHEGERARPGRLADWLGVSPPTVSVSLQRLARDGWVTVEADRSVRLTEAGSAAAAEVVRRHRIIERWLTDALGLDWVTADREAAALAHDLSDIVLDRLDAQLGHPSTCPHGNVIPGRRPPKGRSLVHLSDAGSGIRTRVARVSEVAEHEAPQLLGELHRAGIVPGVAVEILAATPTGPARLRVGEDTGEVELSPTASRAVWVESAG